MSAVIYPCLAGQHVFITGGASGIGAALVSNFVQQQAKVSFVDVDENAAQQLLQKLKVKNLNFQCCDVTDISALKSSIANAAKLQGDITVLINNVANDQRYDSRSITEQQWRRSMAINVDPAFFAAQAIQPMMARAGGGAIINFSSINALLGPADMPSYNTAKAALLGMTKALARDFGADNIRVNALLPGWVVTEKQLDKWLTPEAEKQWLQQVCLQKRILPQHVADLVLFLSSAQAQMITSQQFVIDGGRL